MAFNITQFLIWHFIEKLQEILTEPKRVLSNQVSLRHRNKPCTIHRASRTKSSFQKYDTPLLDFIFHTWKFHFHNRNLDHESLNIGTNRSDSIFVTWQMCNLLARNCFQKKTWLVNDVINCLRFMPSITYVSVKII